MPDRTQDAAPVRRSLSDEARAELGAAVEGGNRSSMCHFGGWQDAAPTSVCGRPHENAVQIDEPDELREPMTLDAARSLAIALLEAAAHAEFGPE